MARKQGVKVGPEAPASGPRAFGCQCLGRCRAAARGARAALPPRTGSTTSPRVARGGPQTNSQGVPQARRREGAAGEGGGSDPRGARRDRLAVGRAGCLHAVCKPGPDPAECEARIQSVVEALERVVTREEDSARVPLRQDSAPSSCGPRRLSGPRSQGVPLATSERGSRWRPARGSAGEQREVPLASSERGFRWRGASGGSRWRLARGSAGEQRGGPAGEQRGGPAGEQRGGVCWRAARGVCWRAARGVCSPAARGSPMALRGYDVRRSGALK